MATLRSVLPSGAVAAAFCLIATPAAAHTTATSDVVVTVPGGALQIAVAQEPVTLATISAGAAGTVIGGRLGKVTVKDLRNAPAGSEWAANVVATNFTGRGEATLPARQVRYTVGQVVTEGTVTVNASPVQDLHRPRTVVSATAVAGNNSASWTPTLTVTIPAGLPPGTYWGTITHSVL